MSYVLHFGDDALPCPGGTPAVNLTVFVEAHLTTGEIIQLGRRIAEHHGLNTYGPLDRKSTVAWFEAAIADCIEPADATTYLRELERRMLAGEPFVMSAAGSVATRS
jgi:hypothetical protein